MKKFFYSDIGTCHDFGDCDAFVVDTEAENLGNWLETCGFDKEKLLGDLRNRFKRIAIILGITVDDKHRGEGIGRELLEAVIDKAIDEGAESIILECDLVETNNFDLQKWYERYDFVVIDRKCNPLMLAEFY